MLIPNEKINEAKDKYGENAIEEIISYFGVDNYDEKKQSCSCPFHEDKTPSFIWNPNNNSFHCFSCSRNFGILDLYLEQGNTYIEAVEKLFEKTNTPFSFASKGLHKKTSYVYPHRVVNDDRSLVEKYCGFRGISKKTLDYADIQQDDRGNMVYHYYDSDDVLLSVKYRPARKLNSNDIKCWFQSTDLNGNKTHIDNSPILFNMNRIDPTKPLVITEGECFKGDTEVLTPNGWVRLDEYDGQQVMQIDNELNGYFCPPVAYIKKEYSGDMIRATSHNYSYETTENHNVVYLDTKKNIIKEPISGAINNDYLRIPTSIRYNSDKEMDTKNRLALIILLFVHCEIKGITATLKEQDNKKCNKVKDLLRELDIRFYDNLGMTEERYLQFTVPAWFNNISFEDLVFNTSYEDKRYMIDELKYWSTTKQDTTCYTIEQKHATVIQTIGHLVGYRINITKSKNKYKIKIIESQDIKIPQNAFNREYYEGLVYCVSVPTGMILIRQNNQIYVCGNCDCLSVIEAGYTNAVSIPNGAPSMQWIEYNWEWLEQFDKIILWGDNDDPGKKFRSEALKRLGSWRTYYIETDSNEIIEESPWGLKDRHIGHYAKDANDVLIYFGKQRILEYIHSPIETPVEGVLDLCEAEDFDIESVEGLQTGIKVLDERLYKLVFGTLNIVTGKSGSGKSIFVNQVAICQALNQGYDVFAFSGELPAPNLKDWVETNLMGRDNITLKNNNIRIFEPKAKEDMRKWYRGRVMVYDDSLDCTASSILAKMEEMARKFGTKVFLIDNLMMVDLECNEESRLQAEKNFVKNLIFFAKRFEVLVFLVAHPRKTGEAMVTKDDISGSSNIVNLAHMVFSVHRYTEKERLGEVGGNGRYLKGKEPKKHETVVSVLKNRINGLLPSVEMYFDYPSYRLYTTPEELWFRYKWNRDTTPLRTDDPNAESRELIIKGESPL